MFHVQVSGFVGSVCLCKVAHTLFVLSLVAKLCGHSKVMSMRNVPVLHLPIQKLLCWHIGVHGCDMPVSAVSMF